MNGDRRRSEVAVMTEFQTRVTEPFVTLDCMLISGFLNHEVKDLGS